jgi:toxin ParE1/3/4
MSYVFHPDAAAEHLESVAFYESRLAGFGADYLAVFDSAMLIVCHSPQQHPIDTPPCIRICYMKKFPFSILFREIETGIQVLAVAHQRRQPKYWSNRALNWA